MTAPKCPPFTPAEIYKALAPLGFANRVPKGGVELVSIARFRRGLMRVYFNGAEQAKRAREALSVAGYDCRSGLTQHHFDLIGPGYEE